MLAYRRALLSTGTSVIRIYDHETLKKFCGWTSWPIGSHVKFQASCGKASLQKRILMVWHKHAEVTTINWDRHRNISYLYGITGGLPHQIFIGLSDRAEQQINELAYFRLVIKEDRLSTSPEGFLDSCQKARPTNLPSSRLETYKLHRFFTARTSGGFRNSEPTDFVHWVCYWWMVIGDTIGDMVNFERRDKV